MRIVIITQDEPFYLAKYIDYFLKKLPTDHNVVGCVLLQHSPHGKKKSFFKKIIETLYIFGFRFFLYYMVKYLWYLLCRCEHVAYIVKKHNISVISLEKSLNNTSSVECIMSLQPDLLISIQANEIFKKSILNVPVKGCINLHTALLPKYRGLLPTFWVLHNNEDYTGVSVFFMDEGIDSGDILVQEKIKIENRSMTDLIKETKKRGMDALLKAIDLINTNTYRLIPNDENDMSYYGFPTHKDVREFYKKGKRLV